MLAIWLSWLAWYLARHTDTVQARPTISVIFFITFVLLFFALTSKPTPRG